MSSACWGGGGVLSPKRVQANKRRGEKERKLNDEDNEEGEEERQ